MRATLSWRAYLQPQHSVATTAARVRKKKIIKEKKKNIRAVWKSGKSVGVSCLPDLPLIIQLNWCIVNEMHCLIWHPDHDASDTSPDRQVLSNTPRHTKQHEPPAHPSVRREDHRKQNEIPPTRKSRSRRVHSEVSFNAALQITAISNQGSKLHTRQAFVLALFFYFHYCFFFLFFIFHNVLRRWRNQGEGGEGAGDS